MATHKVSFDGATSYRTSLNKLHDAMTDGGWPNRTRANSKKIHTVEVSRGTQKGLSLFMRESDLYVIGFRTSAGVCWYFADDVDPAAKSPKVLGISGSYTGNDRNNLGVLVNACKDMPWSGGEIETAIGTLLAYSGGNYDTALRLALGIFAYSLAEAMRFVEIFKAVQAASSKGQKKLKFWTYEPLVTNWSKFSKGNHDDLNKLKTKKT